MFGFLASPCRCGPDPEDASAYGRYFCGLANRLHADYGGAARWLVNRDATFLSFFTAAQGDEEPTASWSTCCNPMSRPIPRFQDGLHARYAAAVTVCGLCTKIRDEMDDAPRLWRPLFRLADAAARSRGEKAIRFLTETGFPVNEIRRDLESQTALERRIARGEAHPIEAAEPTARAYGGIFRHTASLSGAPANRAAATAFGEHFGQAAYWHDAAMDLSRDRRSGKFNPWLIGRSLPAPAEILSEHLQGMAQAIRSIGWRRYAATIEDVIARQTPVKAFAAAGITPTEKPESDRERRKRNRRMARKKQRCWEHCDVLGCDCCDCVKFPCSSKRSGGKGDCLADACPCDGVCPDCPCDC